MAKPRTYIIGIAGTGTGALAGLLAACGHDVTGSDAHVYPPMSEKLAEWGVPVLDGFDAAHLSPPPDLVVVGNVVRENNPEAQATRAQKLPTLSMPQAVAKFGIGERHSVVVAGTHGKTTTTALLAHVLMDAGRDPGFLVGGALVGYSESFRLGSGDTFVVEGDEYDTAYFDKGPKFLHYRGRTVIITSLEFDHADIFADVEAVEAAFAKLVAQVPQDGHLIVCGEAVRARRLVAQFARCRKVTFYGAAANEQASTPAAAAHTGSTAPATNVPAHATLVASEVVLGPHGVRFTLPAQAPDGAHAAEPSHFSVGLWGNFSVDNALAVVAATRSLGLTDAQIAHGLDTFCGVRRRMEVRADVGNVVLIDDFGHHPTAVTVTLAAARSRFPGRRLWAIFEPRSATSRRNTFEQAYVQAFAGADCTLVAHHPRLQEVAEDVRFSPTRVAQALEARGAHAAAPKSTAEIVAHVRAHVRPGDVVMVLSNGDFDGLLPKLEAVLQERTNAARTSAVAAP